MPNKTTDQEICQTLLNLTKQHCAQTLNDVLECANPQLRQEFEQILQQGVRQQYEFWQFMHQRDYYQPLPASQEQLRAAQQGLQGMQQNMGAVTGGGVNPQPVP